MHAKWKLNLLIVPILRSIELRIYLMHPSFWGFSFPPSSWSTRHQQPHNVYTRESQFSEKHRKENFRFPPNNKFPSSTIILQHQFIYVISIFIDFKENVDKSSSGKSILALIFFKTSAPGASMKWRIWIWQFRWIKSLEPLDPERSIINSIYVVASIEWRKIDRMTGKKQLIN